MILDGARRSLPARRVEKTFYMNDLVGKVIREALFVAGLGYVLVAVILLLFAYNAPRDVLTNPQFVLPVLISTICLFVVAGLLGRFLGIRYSTAGLGRGSLYGSSVLIAWTTVVLATTIGCLPNVLIETRTISATGIWLNADDYLLKPLFSVCFVGFLPATLLGVYLAARIERLGSLR